MEKSSQTAFSYNKNFPWNHCGCCYYFTLTKTIHFQKINILLGPKLACPPLIKIKVKKSCPFIMKTTVKQGCKKKILLNTCTIP